MQEGEEDIIIRDATLDTADNSTLFPSDIQTRQNVIHRLGGEETVS